MQKALSVETPAEECLLFGPHAAPGGRGGIVVAREVEDAMDQEEGKFLVKGMTMLRGLAGSGLNRDDHIAQEMRLRRGETLLLREG